MADLPFLSDYPLQSHEKLRYSDCDPQGHVNNAVFATMLETGRVEMLLKAGDEVNDPGCDFVLASMKLDFVAEVRWPGRVEIGTRVAKIGNSSFTLDQAIFQAGRCVATATTVIVQMDQQTRRSHKLSERAAARLSSVMKK